MEQKTLMLIVVVVVIAVGIVLVLNPQLLGKASGTTGNTTETNPAYVVDCVAKGCTGEGCYFSHNHRCGPIREPNGDVTCGSCSCVGNNCSGMSCRCAMNITEKKEDKPN